MATKKVVINQDNGVFSLSAIALKKYMQLKGKEVYAYEYGECSYGSILRPDIVRGYSKIALSGVAESVANGECVVLSTTDIGGLVSAEDIRDEDKCCFVDFKTIPRDDLDLVQVVEYLEFAANNPGVKLKVVEIPDNIEYEIKKGMFGEYIVEKDKYWC